MIGILIIAHAPLASALREAALHVAVYAGVPAANRAFKLAKQELAKRKEPTP